MLKFKLALIAGLFGAAMLPAFAAGIVHRDLAADSAALRRPIPYAVYEPEAAPPAGGRWPALYLLHGGGGNETDWLDIGHIAQTMDAEIAAGRVKPMIVVMATAGPDSWWVDNPDPGGAGAVETALTGAFIDAIDAKWPTAACRKGRAIGGLSTGGYGAALFALDHPERYAAAILLSGAISPPIDPGDTARIKRGQEFYDGAFGNPFDMKRFNELNVFPRVDRDAKRPDRPAFWMTAGDQDGMGIITGEADFHVALRRAGYDTTLRIGPGHHDWTNWSQAIVPALEWLSPRLTDHCAGS